MRIARSTPRTRLLVAIPSVAALLTLAACGTTEAPAAESTAAASATSTASGPVTLTDSRGKTITLKSPAKKVVALEWAEAEQLVTLGVAPAGVADVEGYGTWVTAEKLPAGTKNVGTRTEPSVDAIVALQPDLVLANGGNSELSIVPQLEKYVPVVVTKGSDATRNLTRMREDFELIAKATGTSEKADAVLAGMDEDISQAKSKVAASGKAGSPLVVTYVYDQGGATVIRVSGKGSMVQDLGEAVGMTTAWTGEVDKQWGLGQTDVEGLKALTDPTTQWRYFASDGIDLVTTTLAKNPIWTGLPWVQAGGVAKLPDGVWAYGGPASSVQFVDVLADSLTP